MNFLLSPLRCALPVLVLAACASQPPPEPPMTQAMPEPAPVAAPKSVLLEASKPRLQPKQFSAEIALTNETSTMMVVHPKDIVCQRGDTVGKAASVFHRTRRDIELYPNRMVRFQLVCKTGKASGNLAVSVPRAYPRVGKKLGSEMPIAAEWSYLAEESGNRNVSSNSDR